MTRRAALLAALAALLPTRTLARPSPTCARPLVQSPDMLGSAFDAALATWASHHPHITTAYVAVHPALSPWLPTDGVLTVAGVRFVISEAPIDRNEPGPTWVVLAECGEAL